MLKKAYNAMDVKDDSGEGSVEEKSYRKNVSLIGDCLRDHEWNIDRNVNN
jgi:hypothetical protein